MPPKESGFYWVSIIDDFYENETEEIVFVDFDYYGKKTLCFYRAKSEVPHVPEEYSAVIWLSEKIERKQEGR